MARPTKYMASYSDQARKLCRLGATNEELADFFEVHVSTIYEWQANHKTFSDALKSGKMMADAEVADKLYHRALGYSHEEVKLATHEGSFTDERVITKHYPPDPTSAIFWLKNRQPDKWRDKQEVEQTTTVHNIMPVPVADNAEQWERAAKANQDGLLKRDS